MLANELKELMLSQAFFWQTKKSLTQSCVEQLANCKNLLRTEKSMLSLQKHGFDVSNGKISIGENYQDCPYQVLDFPRLRTEDSFFLFRTLIIWGNFCAVYAIVGGKSTEWIRENIRKNIVRLHQNEFLYAENKAVWRWEQNEPLKTNCDLNADVFRLGKILLMEKKELLPDFMLEVWSTLTQDWDW